MSKYIFIAGFLLLGLSCSAQGVETVTNVQELLSVQKKLQDGVRFEITGQIVIPPKEKGLFFFVDTGKQLVLLYERKDTPLCRCAIGDVVQISGATRRSRKHNCANLHCTRLRVLSHGTLPEVPVISIANYLAADYTNKLVSIRGTLTDVFPDYIDARYTHLVLSDGDKVAYLVCRGMTADFKLIQKQRGMDVIATGVGCPYFGTRVFTAALPLWISGPSAIRIVDQSNTNSFAAPEFLNYRQITHEFGKLQKLHGVVSARWNGDSFLLQLPNEKTACVELIDDRLPRLGETVEAIGFLETDLIDLYLLRASWQPTDVMNPPTVQPIKTTLRDLFSNVSGTSRIPPRVQGQVFQIQGTVKNVNTDRNGFKSILLAEGKHSIVVNCSCVDDAIAPVVEGCVIDVFGVCIKDSDVWRTNVPLPKIRGLFLVLNNAKDIRIISTPPWWTPARLVLALIVLLVILAAILIWNVTLRAMVARKSRALLREQAAKLEETLKIDERTRLAAELHDYLAQNLTVISYQVSAAESALAANSADTAECLKTADRMLLSCRADLRRCLWDLKSDALNEPEFAKAIERTSEPVSGDARLLVRFAVSRNRLNDSTAHAILSICRELVANAVRHGKADKVQIAGELKDGALRFSVRDNGIGFDPTTRPGQTDGHFGLDGVAERIRRFNGELQIDSSPGKGTRIVVTLRPKDSPT